MIARGSEASGIVQQMCQKLHDVATQRSTSAPLVVRIVCEEAKTSTEGVLVLCGQAVEDPLTALNNMQRNKDPGTLTLRQMLTQNVFWKERERQVRSQLLAAEQHSPAVSKAQEMLGKDTVSTADLKTVCDRVTVWSGVLAQRSFCFLAKSLSLSPPPSFSSRAQTSVLILW